MNILTQKSPKPTPNGVPPTAIVRNRVQDLCIIASNNATKLNGYLYVQRSQNKELFRYLDRFGFFQFHRSNRSKRLVAIHQIVLYFYKGYKRYYYGNQVCVKGTLEIHHLNHNTTDNDKKNLWYVTPTENKVLADITQVCLNKAQGLYNGMAKFDLDKINFYRDISMSFPQLLVKTLIATSNKFVNEG